MRLPEKTVEVNLASQMNEVVKQRLFWFGPTRKQEAQAGFDLAARTARRVLLLQIKASDYVKQNDARQFQAPHRQMQALRNHCGIRRTVFYAFPMVGNTSELRADRWLLDDIWYLDVASLPKSIPPPLVRDGSRIRKNGIHYIDVWPGYAEIHSRTFEVPLVSSERILEGVGQESVGAHVEELGAGRLDALLHSFSGSALGLIF